MDSDILKATFMLTAGLNSPIRIGRDMWREVNDSLRSRNDLFRTQRLSISRNLQISNVDSRKFTKVDVIAYIDSFIEVAQEKLTMRARAYNFAGGACSALALAVPICFLVGLVNTEDGIFGGMTFSGLVKSLTNGELADQTNSYFSIVSASSFSYALVTLHVLKLSTIAAISTGLVYKLGYLARSCFAEAASIFAKRHALRFGRLYLTLKVMISDINPDEKIAIDAKDLESIFSWNIDYKSVFSLDKSDPFPLHIIPQVLSIIKDIAETTSNLKAPDPMKTPDPKK